MQCFQSALAYFDSDVSYVCKMIMKLTPGGNIRKLFSFITDEHSKQAIAIVLCRTFQPGLSKAGVSALRVSKKISMGTNALAYLFRG